MIEDVVVIDGNNVEDGLMPKMKTHYDLSEHELDYVFIGYSK